MFLRKLFGWSKAAGEGCGHRERSQRDASTMTPTRASLLPWCPTTVQYLNYPTPNQYPLHYWLHHPWLNGGVDMKGQMAQFCPYNLLITSGIGVLPSRSWKLLLRTTGWVSGEGKSCIDCKQGYSSLPLSQMQQSLICSPILHGARTKVDTTLRCWSLPAT